MAMFLSSDSQGSEECQLFAASGDVTRDSITILAKTRDLYWKREQRIWYSPRADHAEGDTIHFRNISIPQCSLTYKFIATNSIVKDQTAGYGINEYGLAIISHDMDSWDDDNLGPDYFHDQDYVALVLARCRNALEAIDLFDELILPHGINAEAYLIADPNGLWLLETTGCNWVAKPIVDDVVSCRFQQYTIRNEWNQPGKRHNACLKTNAAAHGCDTTSLDFAECFGNRPPGTIDPSLWALKQRGDITVQDMRNLATEKAYVGTVSACTIPVRSDVDPGHFSFMWDSRADPEYGQVFLPFWMAISDSALPYHYTSWPPEDPDCAWNIFTQIVQNPQLRSTAKPIWAALQVELDAEFDSVEAAMQAYLDSNDLAGLQSYIDDYVFAELDSAYELAVGIINNPGGAVPFSDLTITLADQDVLLSWSAVTEDDFGNPIEVDQYLIYRDSWNSTRPGVQPFDTTTDLYYLDTTGVVQNTQGGYLYWLVAEAGCWQSQPSGKVGDFPKYLIATDEINCGPDRHNVSSDHGSYPLSCGQAENSKKGNK